MTKSVYIFLAASAAIVVGTAAYLGSSARGVGSGPVKGVRIAASTTPAPEIDPVDNTAVVGMVVSSIQLGHLSPAEQQRLRGSLDRALRVYFSGTRDDYLAWMTENRLDPDPTVANEHSGESAWVSRTRLLRASSILPTRFAAREAPSAEHASALNTKGQFIALTRENRGSNDVPLGEADRTVLVSLLLDAPNLRGNARNTATVKFSLEMIRRPSDGAWVVKKVILSEVPSDYFVSLPPI